MTETPEELVIPKIVNISSSIERTSHVEAHFFINVDSGYHAFMIANMLAKLPVRFMRRGPSNVRPDAYISTL